MAKKGPGGERMEVPAPNFETRAFKIQGVSPYVQHKFSAKTREKMRATQEAGAKAKTRKAKEPKDFKECYENAKHVSADGWCGIPAPAFRNAMISACRAAGIVMTRTKLCVFIEPDGFDREDGTPLVKITKGEPAYHEASVRNESGVTDIRARPMWHEGWEATVRVRFDADMMAPEDVANLLLRAGLQVGVGEGRPDSRKSCGMGWGLFTLN